MNKWKSKKEYKEQKEKDDKLFQKIRDEYENGSQKKGYFRSIQALSKKYGITKRRIYHRKQKENWDDSKNLKMRKNDRIRDPRVKMSGFFLEQVKKKAHLPFTEKQIATLCGTNSHTWIKYKKMGFEALSTLFTHLEDNDVNDVNTSTLDLAKQSKLFTKIELFAIEFVLLYFDGIAKREESLYQKMLDCANGIEWEEIEEDAIIDSDGNVTRKIKKRKKRVHPDIQAKWALKILTHSPAYKNDWVAPNQSDITIGGNDQPILVEEKNKMVDDFIRKFLPEQIPEGEIENG